MLIVLAASALVAGLGARPAALAGPDPSAYAAWLWRRVQVADRAFGAPPCPDAEIRSLSATPVSLAELASARQVSRARRGPVVVERVRLSGCGRAVVHNLQVIRTRTGEWEAVAVLPGASLASPRMQTEAQQRVAAAAVNGTPRLPCSAPEAVRSSTNGEAVVLTPPDPGGAWRERWPISMCGQDRTVEVTFGPDRAGRSALISVAPAWR